VKLTGSAVLAVAALGALVLLYLRYADSVKKVVTTTLNPASSENAVNQGVSSIVTAATGRDESLGGWLYEVTHSVPSFLRSPGAATVKPTVDPLPV
jgi:hypothetical protein